MADTAVQRYLTLADRGYRDDAAYEELVALVAADAVVDLDGTPVHGTHERLTSVAGIEYATLDSDGLISALRNEPIQEFHSEPPE